MSLPTAISAGLQGAGLLSSLLGGGNRPNYNALNGGVNQLQGYQNQYGDLGSPALANYGTDNAASNAAANQYEQYLKTDPFTDQRDTQAVAQANMHGAQAYEGANAALTRSLTQRGINPNSSVAVGGFAQNAENQANGQANAQNQLAFQKQALHDQNLATLANFTNGRAGQDFSRASSATGAGAGIQNNINSILGMEANGNFNADNANSAQQSGQAAGLGSSLGGLLAGFGAKKPATGTPAPYDGLGLNDTYGLPVPQGTGGPLPFNAYGPRGNDLYRNQYNQGG